MIDDKQDFSLSYWSLRKEKLKSVRKFPLFSSIEAMFTRHRKLSGIVWTATTRGCTSRSHTSNILPARLAERDGALNSSPHSWIFTSGRVGSKPRSYLFTSATSRIGVHTAKKVRHKTCPTCDTLHFWDPRGAALLRHRNLAAISALTCEQKHYSAAQKPAWVFDVPVILNLKLSPGILSIFVFILTWF